MGYTNDAGSVLLVQTWDPSRVLKSPRLTVLSTGLAMCVVPVTMMWEVLFFNQNAHLANPGAVPHVSTITDLDGAARMAYLLSDMSTPWAHTSFISSPSGAGIWRFQSMSQMIQIVFLWVMSHLVQPMLAANLLVLIGWIATGIATFVIARNVGCRLLVAVSCAMAVQMVPFMRFMAANFTSYVNIGPPLLCLIAALKFSQNPSKRSTAFLVLSLLVTSFFDPYWILFAVFGCTIVIFMQTSSHAIKARSMRTAFIPILVLGVYASLSVGLRFVASNLGQGSIGRSVVVASRDDVGNSVLNWTNWTQSAYTGVGWLILALFALSLVFLPWIKQRNLAVLTIVALTFISVASKISVPLTNIEVMPAIWLRHVMPGVRFFDRVALLAIPLVIVVVARTFEEVSARFKLLRFAYLVIPLLVLMLPLSYPNINAPTVLKSYDDWSGIRSALANVPSAKVLALPFDRRGRDWIEQASFRKPLVNDLVTPVMNQQVILHASHGPASLASFLNAHDVTHVFSIDNELDRFVDYKLLAPRFLLVGKLRLNGFGEGDYEMSAYRVVAQPNDSYCRACGLGPHISVDTQVSGDLVYPPETTSDGEKRWWIGGEKTQISFYSMGEKWKVDNAPLPVSFRLSLSPCTLFARIKIVAGDFIQEFDLDSVLSSQDVEVELKDKNTRTIEISAAGKACYVPGDGRQLLVQLSDLNA